MTAQRNNLRAAWRLLPFAVVLLLLCSALGETQPDPWLILASGEVGVIGTKTTRADLVRAFGAANVVDQAIELGEGETEPGTVVFPKDPKRMIEILWKDSGTKVQPKSATIRGDSSNWKAVHGITLGTSLKELERINGKPFRMAGFGWDYSGTVMSWDGGILEKEIEGNGRVIVRLGGGSTTTQEEGNQVMGDRDFSSHHPVMQKMNGSVYEMVWIFPDPGR